MTRDERIDTHRWLCRKTAARFVRPGLERADLEQVAVIGLIKASDRYDGNFGTPFSAFARKRILGELMHYVRDHETLIRLPRFYFELHKREQEAQEALQTRLGRTASLHEIADELSVSAADLVSLYEARYRRNVADIDSVPEQRASSTSVEQRAVILSSLHALERDERLVLMGVYGLRLSQTDVGQKLGYSQRSSSRLHKRALQKISLALRDHT